MKTFTLRAAPVSPVARPVPTRRTVRRFIGVTVELALFVAMVLTIVVGWYSAPLVDRVQRGWK